VPIALTLEFLISADLSLADAESGSEKGFTHRTSILPRGSEEAEVVGDP
jgi:hypothetical protein